MKSFLDFKSIDEQISEVLSKDASAGEWISDFVKSDNPKFAGKSEAKRKEMALAAYYAAQRNEAVMQPNGTDKIIPDEGMGLCQACGSLDCKEHSYKSPAVTGYVKEDLDEMNIPLGIHHAGKSPEEVKALLDIVRKQRSANEKKARDIITQHLMDMQDAKQRQRNEAVDIPVHTSELQRIHKEYTHHKSRPTADVLKTHKGLGRVQSQSYTAGDMGGKEGLISDIMHNKHGEKRMAAYHALSSKAKKSLSEEVSEFDEPVRGQSRNKVTKTKTGTYVATNHSGNSKSFYSELEAKKHAASGSDVTEELELDEGAMVDDLYKVSHRNTKTGERKEHEVRASSPKEAKDTIENHYAFDYANHKHLSTKKISEEVEELDEISKETLGSYVGKSFSAGNVLHKQIKTETDPQKKAQLQAKLSQRNQGIIKAAQKMRNEEVELDEAKEMTHAQVLAKIKTGSHEAVTDIKPGKHVELRNSSTGKSTHVYVKEETEELEESWEVYDTKTRAVHSAHPTQRKALNAMNKLNDKHPGYETPGNLIASKFGARVSKSIKEGTETMLTYTEFMAQLEESRADDLKDKLAADREARLDKMDFSKEKEAKKSPISRVKGHSYGGQEDGEDKPEKVEPATPEVKRGRGRPSGSKSGAR